MSPMRKHITITSQQQSSSDSGEAWLDLERLATVEVSSEDPSHPIESALIPGATGGWRASTVGEQVVRIQFDSPQHVRRIRLRFEDPEALRTQEFVVRCASPGQNGYRDVVRQQFTFSPSGATREQEEYTVDLAGVIALELRIVPDIAGGPTRAMLAEWRIAA